MTGGAEKGHAMGHQTDLRDNSSDPQDQNPAQPGDGQPATPPVAPPTLEQVVEVLRDCYDPEIPVNVYDLGLIYSVEVKPDATVAISMTLTSPACMMAELIPAQIKNAVERMAGVKAADVQVVWDPPWDTSKMTDAAKLQLNLM